MYKRDKKAPTLEKADQKSLQVISAGGGGWGNPLLRDPELVRHDVEFGYVSMEGAKRDYGVVLKKDKDLSVDSIATKKLRAKLKKTPPRKKS